ncbi:hypothetical protein [Paenibacillus andongensis]|uniref:hypothetical protein n=1 Tax=Paenibacillus andongensis TaxID=2975482 RepID=UPI0021BAE822|nr:hypothetical protein [Paenibacillus andongensis]
MLKYTILAFMLVFLFIGCESNKKSVENSSLATASEVTESLSLISPSPSSKVSGPEQTAIATATATPTAANMSVNSIIPVGWHILEKVKGEPIQVEGDLNNDRISDIAAIIEKTSNDKEAPPRSLLIAFGTKDHTYTISIIADKVVLKADEGGVWGDPFESLTIDRGSVVISDYGGSNWRWYNKYRFRYQDHDWFLIGATMGTYFTGTTTRENADEDDYNLLTGEYITRKTDEQGHIKTTKGNRGRKELVRLKDFNINDM